MPDICTLILVTTSTLQMCYSKPLCDKIVDNKVLCDGIHAVPCGSDQPPAYECKRADGTTYIWQDDGKR
jgi:hypothetical protein